MLLMNNKQEFNIVKEGVTILVEMVLHVLFPFENFAKINLFIRLRLNNSQCRKELWTKVFKQELEVTLVSIGTFWVWDSLECNCKSWLIITFLCQFQITWSSKLILTLSIIYRLILTLWPMKFLSQFYISVGSKLVPTCGMLFLTDLRQKCKFKIFLDFCLPPKYSTNHSIILYRVGSGSIC